MPFSSSFDDIYEFGIKMTCSDLNSYAERVDEQIFKERILDRIYNQISKADVIIADMTGRNPNVYYEVGYAHGIGKDVILLTQDSTDIPFDLKHFPHIIYNNNIKKLSEQLYAKLDWYFNLRSESENESLDFGLEFKIDGKNISPGSEFEIKLNTWFGGIDKLKIDIYNSHSKIHNSKFKIGLEISEEDNLLLLFNSVLENKSIKPSEDRVLHLSKEIENIYPNAYESVSFSLNKNGYFDEQKTIDIFLKIFTNVELKEIPFKIQLIKSEHNIELK